MEYVNNGTQILVRMQDGDELMTNLKLLAKKENLKSASITGIGSARVATLAHYDSKKKKFNPKKFSGMLEIVSLLGSIAELDNAPAIHIHMIVSKHDYSTVSGHLVNAEIFPTCELVITPLKSRIIRKFDSKTGLNLQHFGK